MNNSYKGKILISTPDISGDIFSRSVVLIIEHNESGAFGLILNKKNNFLSKRFNKIMQNDIEVYEGLYLRTKYSLLFMEKELLL